MQHDCFSSFNQSNPSFVALPLPLLSSFLKPPNNTLSFGRLRQGIYSGACRTCSTKFFIYVIRSLFSDVIIMMHEHVQYAFKHIFSTAVNPSKFCVYMKTTRVKRHFAHFVQRDQEGIITKHLTYCEVLLRSDTFVMAAFEAT